jgi:hypothetical protein
MANIQLQDIPPGVAWVMSKKAKAEYPLQYLKIYSTLYLSNISVGLSKEDQNKPHVRTTTISTTSCNLVS